MTADVTINVTPPPPIEITYSQGGAVGPQGPKGDRGDIGVPNQLKVGNVSSGTAASVTLSSQVTTSTSASQLISFVLPKGDAGLPNALTLGSVSSGTAASVAISAQVTTSTSASQTISFVLQKGDTGADARQIELQKTSTDIQWRRVGDASWSNLVSLSAITGPQGRDGSIVEFQSTADYIQWRFVGESTWTNLVPLSSITGRQGATGPSNVLSIGTVTASSDGTASATLTGSSPAQVLNLTLPRGAAGAAARNVEFQSTSTSLQYRLVGDTTWNDLVPLSSITGPQGSTGATGQSGAAASVSVGTVATGAADSSVAVTNSGTSSAAVLNFTIPRGSQGIQGVAGPANSLSIGTVTASSDGTASASISGTAPNQTLSLTLPRGNTGSDGKTVELRATSDYLQWRTVGDSSWTNLVSLSAITGPQGPYALAEYDSPADFPATGQSQIVYVSRTRNRIYRWDGTYYVEMGVSGGGSSGNSGIDWLLRDLFKPGAPTGVTATAGNAQATVSWTAPTVLSQTPITDYVVQYSGDSGSTWTTFADGTSTATTATVTGLSNGTAYTFRVAAVNGVGTGSYSTASSAVTPQAGDPLFGNVSLLLHMDGSNGSTVFTDSSPYARAVTAVGSSTISTAQSKFGGASGNIGGANYLTVANSSDFDFGSGDFTIEFWLYFTFAGNSSASTYYQLFSRSGNSSQSLSPLFLEMFGNKTIRLSVTADGRNWAIVAGGGGTALASSAWNHVAVTRQSGTFNIYVNGVRDYTNGSVSSAIQSGDDPMAIGLWPKYPVNNGTFLMDDFRITKGVARYTGSTITVPTAAFPEAVPGTDPLFSSVSLLLHADGSGNTFVDSSAYGRTITANGNATQSATQSKWGGKSAYFDGNGDYLQAANSSDFNFGSSDWCVELWLYASAQPLAPIAHQTSYSGGSGWILWNYDNVGVSNATRKLTFMLNGTNFVLTTSSDAYADNTWTHIAVARNGNSVSIFSNGTRLATGTFSGSINNASTPCQIGGIQNNVSWNGTFYFSGYIDDLRITKGSSRGYSGSTITVPTSAFPESPALVPVMTSATTPRGVVSDSGILSTGLEGWHAFDKSFVSGDTTFYASPANPVGHWVQYDYGAATQVSGYAMTSRQLNPYGSTQAPPAWTLSGSGDGTTFTTVDTRTSQTWNGNGEQKLFTLASPASYRYWRWTWTATNSAGSIVIARLQMF